MWKNLSEGSVEKKLQIAMNFKPSLRIRRPGNMDIKAPIFEAGSLIMMDMPATKG